MGWLILNESLDECKAVKRAMAHKASKLGPNTLYALCACLGHKIHRGIVGAMREADDIGDTHALQHVYSVKQRRDQAAAGLLKLIDEELFIIDMHPDPLWTQVFALLQSRHGCLLLLLVLLLCLPVFALRRAWGVRA